MKRLFALALLATVTMVSGCFRFGEQGREPEEEGARGIPVAVAAAELATMMDEVAVTGTIRARREAAVGAQVTARVTEVRVREGEAVRAGEVVIVLDRAEAESTVRQAQAAVRSAGAQREAAQKQLEILEQGARPEERAIARSRLEQAEAAVRTAEADLNRMAALFEEGAVAKQQLDAARMAYETARTNRDATRQALELTQKGARPEEIEAARKREEAAAATLEQARGALAVAEERLGYTMIRSSLTGVVYERDVEPGQVVSAMGGSPLLRVADPESLYYEARVPEGLAARVRAGQRVDVRCPTNGELCFQGEVERVVPVATPGTRDFMVHISVPKGSDGMRPGMFARGSVVVEEHTETVVVPKDALVDRADGYVVFTVRQGKAEERAVVVGLVNRTKAEVLSGVEAGEQVVVEGARALKQGDAVQVRAPVVEAAG